MTDQIIKFDAFNTRLEPGINLIEASAGTGKTYSIAMLVLRFLLEQQYSVEQILVVTFTKAAAQELRDRIRGRIVQARDLLAGNPAVDKDGQALLSWLQKLSDADVLKARKTLAVALTEMDNAHIYTIHGFCQRILGQHALESGQIFGSELLENVTPLKQQIAEDYWRIQTYTRSEQQAALMRSTAKTPLDLLNGISRIQSGSEIIPQAEDLDLLLQSIDEKIEAIRPLLPGLLDTLQNVYEKAPEFLNKGFKGKLPGLLQALSSSLQAERPLDLTRLGEISTAAILAGLNGNKLRGGKKQAFIQQYGIDASAIDPLCASLGDVRIAFQLGLHSYIEQELEKRLDHSNLISFDDMITRLAEVLTQEDSSGVMRKLMQDKFPVALIDEFQDTDFAQWSLFSTLPQKPANFLYLIGDPKQAIYKFRGADIYSYLGAQKQAQRQYQLETNYRSQESLVDAVNALFGVEDPFRVSEIAYHAVAAANRQLTLQAGVQPLEQLVLWELEPNPNHKQGYWSSGLARDAVRQHVVNEILHLLDPSAGVQLGGRTLRPGDFAILVRSNQEAANYQQALREAGLPSVLNSKESVFASAQAIEVYHLLHAISRPANRQLVIYALSLPWFGMSGNDIHALEDSLDDWLSDFQHYHELWQDQGLLAMMQALMQQHAVVQHLAIYSDIERRLTNINHILELLQQTAIEQRLGMVKTLEWLQAALENPGAAEGQELRLESDEDTIKLVTIHSSKGLEYPIVFCPDLWAGGANRKADVLLFHQHGKQVCDLGSESFEDNKKLEQEENRAEELRLLYVAVTRAKYRCYLAWADQRTQKDENQSALAYLLRGQDGESWTQRMYSLLQQAPPCFAYELLGAGADITTRYQAGGELDLAGHRALQREIRADWMMSSYSGLAHYSQHEAAEVPELPLDKSEEQEMADREALPDAEIEELQELPKGAHTGNLVHDLLEHTSFATLANLQEDFDYLQRRDELILRYGVELENKTLLDSLLRHTVNTVLANGDNDFKLANLRDEDCLKEMPFYFAVDRLDTCMLNAVLAHSDTVAPLGEQTLQGQLTGFVDLICKYKGRYYVMDYKTNYLPDYSMQSMTGAMREHNYGLQYWIYSLVLHRYLQQTLEGYDFETHFGGVRYLFVRGMHAEQPMSGVFADEPDLQTLESMAEAFA